MRKVLLGKVRNGFTLIELLVVVAIISILAAILFPVFARARESARRASCLSNMKQIGLGFMMYLQDYDERFPGHRNTRASGDTRPPAEAGGYWTNGYWYWQQLIFPYTKSLQIYFCPSSPGPGITDASKNALHYNYGTNLLVNKSTITLANIIYPSTTYLAIDSSSWRITPNALGAGGFGYIPGMQILGVTATDSTVYPLDWARARHFDGVNLAFADGHAKWLKLQTVYAEAKKCTSCSHNKDTQPATSKSAWNPNAE